MAQNAEHLKTQNLHRDTSKVLVSHIAALQIAVAPGTLQQIGTWYAAFPPDLVAALTGSHGVQLAEFSAAVSATSAFEVN